MILKELIFHYLIGKTCIKECLIGSDISLFGWKNMYDKEYWIGSEDNLNVWQYEYPYMIFSLVDVLGYLFILCCTMQRMLISGSSRHQGKTSFVEHRTFFHLYHSFHRLWIFLFMMFQVCTFIYLFLHSDELLPNACCSHLLFLALNFCFSSSDFLVIIRVYAWILCIKVYCLTVDLQ